MVVKRKMKKINLMMIFLIPWPCAQRTDAELTHTGAAVNHSSRSHPKLSHADSATSHPTCHLKLPACTQTRQYVLKFFFKTYRATCPQLLGTHWYWYRVLWIHSWYSEVGKKGWVIWTKTLSHVSTYFISDYIYEHRSTQKYSHPEEKYLSYYKIKVYTSTKR